MSSQFNSKVIGLIVFGVVSINLCRYRGGNENLSAEQVYWPYAAQTDLKLGQNKHMIMQEPEIYSRNCCNNVNSINGYTEFGTIHAELKHMCLGDLRSKHLQTCLHFI